jgi:predicted ATPase/DNA-binding CsgD family transcriptional regulator
VRPEALPPQTELAPLSPRLARVQPVTREAWGRGGLPQPLTSFVGRDTDVTDVRARLVDGRARLLTLIGPGGVGKTRLAIRLGEVAAAAYAHGVVFVPLAAITDAELVIPAIAQALGLQIVGDQTLTDAVIGSLRQRQMLLVLDNFEQVQLAAAAVAALLVACPGVSVLVTSRVPLRIAGEQRWPVVPLSLPPQARGEYPPGGSPIAAIAASAAVQLFVARAQAINPGFVLDGDNAAAVAAICRRLDGLPLAIELAAARTHLLEPAELLARLSPALPLLTKGPDDAPDRLRTMHAAIAWSYALLSADEQRLFRRLAIFAGGFTLEAAERVSGFGSRVADDGTAGDWSDTLDFLASLVDKSLLQRMSAEGESRFAMLETIREFALEHLVASDEADDIANRHAAWCVALAEAVRRSGRLSHRDGLGLLDVEHPNLRAALDWLMERGETTAALHLAGELAEFWMRHGHWMEGGAWLERLLAVVDDPPTAARASALVGLSMLLWARRDFARARALLDLAEAIAREVGDAGALAYARLHQGYTAAFFGDFDLSMARGEECLGTCHAIPQEFSCNGALWLLAHSTLARGEDERARDLYERLFAKSQAERDDISIANAFVGQAILAERRGDLARALEDLAEAAATSLRFGDAMFLGLCLDHTGMAAAENGRPEPAARFFAAVATLHASVGITPGPSIHADPVRHARATETARAALGDDGFARAWAVGTALSRDEAIAEIAALAREVRTDGAFPGAADELTSREREVLRLLAQGWSDKEIAAALDIGRRTVSTHVATIRAKLKAPSRSAAAAIAARDRLV